MICAFPTVALGMAISSWRMVNALTARQVISLICAGIPSIETQSPIVNWGSPWMASPAIRLPSVSCSARPRTIEKRPENVRIGARLMLNAEDRKMSATVAYTTPTPMS